MSLQSGTGSQQNSAMSTLTQKNARTVSELERIPYLPQVYAIPIEQREKESKLLADAVEFQPKLYQLIEGLATREELTDHCDRIQNIEAEYMQRTVQSVVKTNADTVAQMQTMVEQAGKNQEQFISNCSETLSKSTKALDSTIEKLQQKIMKIIIATAVSAVAMSVLVCVVFCKLAVHATAPPKTRKNAVKELRQNKTPLTSVQLSVSPLVPSPP